MFNLFSAYGFFIIRPKVVGPFPGSYASRSYVHQAALRNIFYQALQIEWQSIFCKADMKKL
jgi:hypothetical protein